MDQSSEEFENISSSSEKIGDQDTTQTN